VAAAAELPEPDDFYRVWGDLQVRGGRGAAVEPDLRTVPWHTLRRLALLGGEFVAPYRPVSAGEISRTLRRARENGGPGLILPAQRRQMAWLLWRHGLGGAAGRWDSCPCRTPWVHVAAGGRLALGGLPPGDLVPGEAGLAARGLHLAIEPELTVWSGPVWGAATVRLAGPITTDGPTVPAAVLYPGWPVPTNRPAAGAARRDEAWYVQLPRGVVGVALGSWSLSAGSFPAAVGPGLEGGGLSLGAQAESLPQVVLRRNRPFTWSGFMGALDPDHLLLRAGVSSEQTLRYQTPSGLETRRAHPAFFQWLITWNHTSWWRTTVTHAVMAAPREGESLWGDLLQVNFPLLDATWNELDYGPVTDRIFTLGMEARFREAPWPLLPSAAGRIWWEYGGEDYRPNDRLSFLPEISAPASLAGVELVDRRWDLAAEYLQTHHPGVLWYSNSGFAEGYANDGVVLGHPLGGGVKAWTGLLRLRSGSGVHEWELRGQVADWRVPRSENLTARRRELGLAWRRLVGGGAWSVRAGWVEEETAASSLAWWQARVLRQF